MANQQLAPGIDFDLAAPQAGFMYGQQMAQEREKQNLLNAFQQLQNERYAGMTPGMVAESDLTGAQSTAMNTPENIRQFVLGKIGSQQQQQALGSASMAELPQKLAKASLFSRFVKSQDDATNPDLPQEVRDAARRQAQETGTFLAESDPANVAKLEQLQLKQKLQGMKPSDVTALMNWSSRTGTPLSTAIELFKSGQVQLGGVGSFESQPTVQQPQGQFAFKYDDLVNEDRASVDLILNSLTSGKLSQQDAQTQLQQIAQKYPSKLQQTTSPIIDQVFGNKSNNATVAERAANLTGSFVQTANDVKNLVESPMGSELGIFSGLNGKDRDTVVTSLSAFMGRKLTPEQDRALQMAVSGFKVTMASVIGGGFATASSKARMDALADQLPREGDPPSAKLIWLARVKQELEAASETFETRESANKEQKQLVKQKMSEINKAIPWDFADVNAALRKQTGQGTTGAAGQSAYGQPQAQYKAGDTKVINGVTWTRNEQGTWDKQ